MAIALVVAMIIFVVNQYQIDRQAQVIVINNNRIIRQFQTATHQLAKQLLGQNFYYDRPLGKLDRKQFIELEQKTQAGAKKIAQTKLKTGINPPSLNNNEITKQKLQNFYQQHQVLISIAKGQVCLNKTVFQLFQNNQRITQLITAYIAQENYTDSSDLIKNVQASYQQYYRDLDQLLSCLDQPLRSASIYQDLQLAIQKDRDTIANYNKEFLRPLLSLYRQENYLRIPDLLAKHRDNNRARLIVEKLFISSQINTQINTNYVATAFRTIVENITNDSA